MGSKHNYPSSAFGEELSLFPDALCGLSVDPFFFFLTRGSGFPFLALFFFCLRFLVVSCLRWSLLDPGFPLVGGEGQLHSIHFSPHWSQFHSLILGEVRKRLPFFVFLCLSMPFGCLLLSSLTFLGGKACTVPWEIGFSPVIGSNSFVRCFACFFFFFVFERKSFVVRFSSLSESPARVSPM